MRRFYCQKCSLMLPKGEIVCEYCGHINESIYPKFEKVKTARRAILILAAVGILILCHVFMLYPWQYQARRNRKAIMKYARTFYPEAKIVKEYYPTMEFNPTGMPYDRIWFELDGVEFTIAVRDGEVNRDSDGYGFGLLRKEIRENYLNDFFSMRGLSDIVDISFSDYSPYWPQQYAVISDFPGTIRLDILLEHEEDKQTLRDFDWLYDFYCYWREVCPTEGFSIRFCYRISSKTNYTIYCYSTSEIDNEEDFYNLMEYIG